MAVGNGHLISGKIGHLVNRVVDGKQVIQGRGKKPKQTEATKKSAALFGTSSSVACWIRRILCHNSDRDRTMASRMTSLTYAALRRCHNKETNGFTIRTDSFHTLDRFDFNLYSPLINSIWIKPQLKIIDNKLTITLPEIKILKHLKFPVGALFCIPILDVFLYVPAEGGLWERSYELEEIRKANGTIPLQEFTIDIPQGSICFVGISLFYYSKEHNLKKMMNNKKFSPAGICGVIVNPGTPTAGDLIGDGWNDDELVKLNNTTFSDLEELELVQEDLTTDVVIPKIIHIKARKAKKADLLTEPTNKEPNPLFTVAANLREMGLQDEDVAKATGLSIEEVKSLSL